MKAWAELFPEPLRDRCEESDCLCSYRPVMLGDGPLFSQRHVNDSCPRDISLFLGTPLPKWTKC